MCFFYRLWYLCAQLSFPTRRSSDLDRRRQPVLHVVVDRERLVCRLEAQHRQDRSENLLLLETHSRAHTAENRRLVEESVDRKSTRLNSSHVEISYAVFCLKKKKKQD